MSYTAAAIRAAKEVQADTLAPELLRQAGEWFFKARHEYKVKNFKDALDFAAKARFFAEQAEFEALRNGGVRSKQGIVSNDEVEDPLSKNQPYAYPTPMGTPGDVYDKRKAEEERGSELGAPGVPGVPGVKTPTSPNSSSTPSPN